MTINHTFNTKSPMSHYSYDRPKTASSTPHLQCPTTTGQQPHLQHHISNKITNTTIKHTIIITSPIPLRTPPSNIFSKRRCCGIIAAYSFLYNRPFIIFLCEDRGVGGGGGIEEKEPLVSS